MTENRLVSRRAVVAGVCGAGCLAVAGCAGYGAGRGAPAPVATPPPGAPGSGGAEALVATADVPVGGGVILAAKGLVVTQPVAGKFQAFSATCTHQGCTVSSVAEGTIACMCHGSRFSAADGSVVQGPASRPLARTAVTVAGSAVTLSA